MSMVENNGNWNELVRERNVAKTDLFLELLREFHPEREVGEFKPEPIIASPPAAGHRPKQANPLPAEPSLVVPRDEGEGRRRYPKVEEIQRIAARHYNVSRHDMVSSRRTADVVRPRQVAMYVTKMLTLRSLPDIGRRFGGRDHTTVLHAISKINSLVRSDQGLAADVMAIMDGVREVADPALGALV